MLSISVKTFDGTLLWMKKRELKFRVFATLGHLVTDVVSSMKHHISPLKSPFFRCNLRFKQFDFLLLGHLFFYF